MPRVFCNEGNNTTVSKCVYVILTWVGEGTVIVSLQLLDQGFY